MVSNCKITSDIFVDIAPNFCGAYWIDCVNVKPWIFFLWRWGTKHHAKKVRGYGHGTIFNRGTGFFFTHSGVPMHLQADHFEYFLPANALGIGKLMNFSMCWISHHFFGGVYDFESFPNPKSDMGPKDGNFFQRGLNYGLVELEQL